MPQELQGPFVLSASLGKILRGEEIEQSVLDAEEVLREYAKHADATSHHLQTRRESKYLRDQLEFEDLLNLANYVGSRKNTSKKRVITFQRKDTGLGIEFVFVRKIYGVENLLDDMVKDARRYDEQAAEKISGSIVATLMTGKDGFQHHSEAVLGAESRTLKPYLLAEVAIQHTSPQLILGFIPWFSQREVIYTNISRKEKD